MPVLQASPGTDGPRPRCPAVIWLLLALTAGCQVPAARPEVGPPDGDSPSRGKTLTHQLVCDTALETAHHPLQAGLQVVTGTAACASLTAREFVSKRLITPLCGPPGPILEDRGCLDPAQLERVLARVTARPLQPAHVQIDLHGEDALRRLEGLIDGAEQSIDVLMYMWDADALGWALAHRLADRAHALPCPAGSAAVRILIDGGGNLIHGASENDTTWKANEVLGWLSEQPNVAVLRTRNALARFDHRKLVVIDGRLAWSGGRNFTLASFFEYHDLSYSLEGPLVRDMAERFEKAWQDSGGQPRPTSDPPVLEVPDANAWARVVGTEPRHTDFARVMNRAVDHACHHVYLENPYFTENVMWCKLVAARRRGADVRVVFAEDSQSRVIDKAMKVTVNRLLQMGVRVYVHPGTTHVKAALVDTRWAYIGTGNFDNMSLTRNHEVGLAIGAGPLVEELEQSLFLADFRPEWEVTQPLKVNLGDYLCEMFANLVL